MIIGYIRFILRLYQLMKLSCRPKNKVKPEQKKNSPSPMAPPVTKPPYRGNKPPCVNR